MNGPSFPSSLRESAQATRKVVSFLFQPQFLCRARSRKRPLFHSPFLPRPRHSFSSSRSLLFHALLSEEPGLFSLRAYAYIDIYQLRLLPRRLQRRVFVRPSWALRLKKKETPAAAAAGIEVLAFAPKNSLNCILFKARGVGKVGWAREAF